MTNTPHRSLFAVHLEGGEIYARQITGNDRADYNAGSASFLAIVLAADELDALDLGRRLADARALLAAAKLETYGSDYRAGYLAALLELKAFLQREAETHRDEPTSAHWLGAMAEIERVSTWAQAFMPTERP